MAPFHTGHLGFLSETPVRVSFLARDPHHRARPDLQRHCEVLVAPFLQEWRYLALVSVTMRDEPGVVARLLAAIAALGINVEVQDSTSIDLLDHHFVNLIVDLSESQALAGAEFALPSKVPTTPPAVQRAYRGFESIFPVHDERFVRLFESIVAHCADIIVWKEISGQLYPDLRIGPMPERPFAKSGNARLRRARRRATIEIIMPEAITHRIHADLGLADTDDIQYILVSDTATRSLRAFFLHPEVTPRLFHVAFEHNDIPGALATVLDLVRRAGFNILTSLSRKRPDDRAVLEALLEFRHEDDYPASNGRPAHSPLNQPELEWLCEVIANAGKSLEVMPPGCGIIVNRPLYPLRRGAPPVRPLSLSDRLRPARGMAKSRAEIDFGRLLRERRADLARGQLNKQVTQRSRELIDILEKTRAEAGRSTVFLSYPGRASKHAHKLKSALEASLEYNVQEYQAPDGETIVDVVLDRIANSDYFIGIWHHEALVAETGGPVRDISPWMLFEYGVARSLGKRQIIVHSDKLDPAIWNRVDPGVSHPSYSDLTFESETIPVILDYCGRHFR